MANPFKSPATIPALLVGIAGVALVLYAWRLPPFTSTAEVTDNAYVRGSVTVISPQLAGYVTQVAVHDYATVRTGDLLIQIDDRIYQQKLVQARAALATAEAALDNFEQERQSRVASIEVSKAQIANQQATLSKAQADERRLTPLIESGYASRSQGDQIRASLDQARAGVAQARASQMVAEQALAETMVNRKTLEAAVQNAQAVVKLAEIDLQNTRITAPQDGQLGEIGARLGQYVTAGTQVMSLVPSTKWIVANFKETQLRGVSIGMPVRFTADAFPDQVLAGHVEQLSPAAGSEFAVLRPDNATGNFTKVVQRIPLRIAIDPGQPLAERLAPGMSVVVTLDAGKKG